MGEKHEPGSMDISEQEKTFEGTMRWAKYVVIGTAVFLIFLAIVNG